MKHREVVANFIFKWSTPERRDQRVALFRRSHHPNVRSYQGKYAPISGSMEANDPSPVSAAEREIHEETQLRPGTDLILEFCGKSYSFEDHRAGRSWTVHPFGWILEVADDQIKIDWEHDSWDWFDPQQVLDSTMSEKCVPKLSNSLQRVYFGPNGIFYGGGYLIGRSNKAGSYFLETVARLKTDIENGARVLAFEALKGLRSIAEYFKCCPIEGEKSFEYWHSLATVAYHFIYSARPSMSAAVRSALLAALEEVEKTLDNHELDPGIAYRIIDDHVKQDGQASNQIAESFKVHIDHILASLRKGSSESVEQHKFTLNIITLSFSSTILKAVTHLITTLSSSIDTVNLTILESRPLCEGANLASSLIKSLESSSTTSSTRGKQQTKLNIKIVPESHSALLFTPSSNPINSKKEDLTIVLLGADCITPHGNVVNKTGSCTLAVLAQTFQLSETTTTKVIVLSESAKIASAKIAELPLLKRHVRGEEEATAKDDKDVDKDRKLMAEAAQQDLLRACPREEHPAKEVYSAWPKGTQDHLAPYLQSPTENSSTDVHQRSDSTRQRNKDINVSIDNVYFEIIPSQYIDVFIGENGELSRQDIMRIGVQRAELEERIFGSLYHD